MINMKNMAYSIIIFTSIILCQSKTDINTKLMNATFKMTDHKTAGTVFILVKPIKENPNIARWVLITANHVLNDFIGDEVSLFLRKKNNSNYQKYEHRVKIRNNNVPLWVKHPNTDVAAMIISIPKDCEISKISTSLLASDDVLEKFEIHPGDKIFCLGYPYNAEANESGFPILRSGEISSYPLTPTSLTKHFLFDFEVFSGNSGGPVYFYQTGRFYGNTYHAGTTIQMLLGLVNQEKILEEKIRSISETRIEKHKMGLAYVIHASFIQETIDLLP